MSRPLTRSISPLVKIDRIGPAAQATVLRSGAKVDLNPAQLEILSGSEPPDVLDDWVRYEANVAWLKRYGILASDPRATLDFRAPSDRIFNLPRSTADAKRTGTGSPLFIGLPWDLGDDFGGASVGPEVIRRASKAYGIDRLPDGWYSHRLNREFPGVAGEDVGDLGCPAISSYQMIRDSLARVLAERMPPGGQARPIFLGGDHGMTYCVLSALQERPASLVVLDAHDDFSEIDTPDPSGLNHGNWLRAWMQQERASYTLLMGLRGVCPLRRGQELRCSGMRVLSASECMREPARMLSELDVLPDGPVYVSIDIDVLDPSLAPGTPCLVSGGLTPQVVEDILIAISERRGLCGLDLMEVSMPRAAHDMTGLIASELLLLASHLLGRA